MPKKIQLQYFALLKEERGLANETIETMAATVEDLYHELKDRHQFSLNTDILRIAINDEFADWKTPIKNNDSIIFIPPVAGG